MRTRQRILDTVYAQLGPFSVDHYSLDHDTGFWVFNAHNDGVGPNTQIPVEYGMEEITDDPTPSNEPKIVVHTKQKFKRFGFNSLTEVVNGDSRYVYAGPRALEYSWGQVGFLSPSNIHVEYAKTDSQLMADAMHQFYSNNEVDNLLNLVESPELVTGVHDLVSTVKRAIRHITQPASGLLNPNKAILKRRVKRVLSGLGGGFLAYSFAVAPLVSDMNKINRGVKSLKDSLDKHIRNYNRPYVTTARTSGIPSIISGGAGWGYLASDTSSIWHADAIALAPPLKLVGCRGVRNVEYSSDAFKRLDYMISRFIATGPASLAWEHMPFSFVVDWFVNLSGILDSLDNTLTGNTKKISSAWSSEKWNLLCPVYKHKTGSWDSQLDGEQIAVNELSYYARSPVTPTITVAAAGRFGKKQVALSAALIHQLVTNLKAFRMYGRL